MYWPVELGRYVLKSGWVTAYTYGMEFISKGGVKIWHLWWDESIWYFLHWKKWIWFSPWWWAQPWWLTLYLHVSCSARFIGDDETQQRYTFRLLWVLWLHGEHREDLNLYSDMENQTIICFALIFAGRNGGRSARRNREKIVEFIFVTSEEGTLFDIDRRSLVCLSLNDDSENNVLKGIQNWSC